MSVQLRFKEWQPEIVVMIRTVLELNGYTDLSIPMSVYANSFMIDPILKIFYVTRGEPLENCNVLYWSEELKAELNLVPEPAWDVYLEGHLNVIPYSKGAIP